MKPLTDGTGSSCIILFSTSVSTDPNPIDQSKRLRTCGDYVNTGYQAPPSFHRSPTPMWGTSRDFAAAKKIGAKGLRGRSWPDLDMQPLGWLTDPVLLGSVDIEVGVDAGLGGGVRAAHKLADALDHSVGNEGNGRARASGGSDSNGDRDPAERGKEGTLLLSSPSFASERMSLPHGIPFWCPIPHGQAYVAMAISENAGLWEQPSQAYANEHNGKQAKSSVSRPSHHV
uniref:Uncharacterized protein n=1 Tax=Ananas comosus var. bracteatus TaxID=296719 RepID=A0A6V7PRX3_ANACO|nr:unnamed protein product [Ananas comosus var. bracteatus]